MFSRCMIKSYVKSHLYLLIAYIMNTFLLVLYYYLSSNKEILLGYTMVLSLSVLTVFVGVDYYKFSKFQMKLSKLSQDLDYDLASKDEGRKYIVKVIDEMRSRYKAQLLSLDHKMKTQEHLYSQWIHNMKTPISVIDLIIQKQASDKQIYLEDIKTENNKLNHQLDQILTLTRLNNFTSDFDPKVVDLLVVLKSVINENKNAFIYKKVFPNLNIEGPCLIISDEKWLRLLLNQVISNAIKYSFSDDQKTVDFLLTNKGKRVSLCIQDQGIGIPSHDHTKIFDAFFTGDNGRLVGNSSGIGLYICKEICKNLNHEIEIESEVFKGTKVYISFLSKL